jgi:hypothetical protein
MVKRDSHHLIFHNGSLRTWFCTVEVVQEEKANDVDAVKIVALLNMADFTHHTKTQVPLDRPLFQPTPTRLTYRDYEPFKTYKSVISLQNQDNVRLFVCMCVCVCVCAADMSLRFSSSDRLPWE